MSRYSPSVKTNATEVTRLAEEVCVKRGGKVTDYAAMHEASKIVLSRDRKLAKAYFTDPHGKPGATTAADDEGDEE